MNPGAKKILSVTLAGFVMLTASAQTAATFGNLPLYFEANASTQFLARGRDAQFLITPAEARLVLQKSDSTRAVAMRFTGANPQAQISGDAALSGKINYLTGNDPAQWRSGIPTFAKVRVAEIYPGINLIYYGNQQQLEYDFTVAPGTNPSAIVIRFDGADKISVNALGELVLRLGDDEIRQPKPLIYQTVGGNREKISGGYKMLDPSTVAFSVGKYDHTLPLVIDPVLSYATYFGGTSGETAWAIALNPNDGSIYIAGQTFSKFAITNGGPFSTRGAFQTNFNGGKQAGDAFVAKFDHLGTNLIYLTYLGGSADDAAYGLAVDGAGDAFVAGASTSTNFPTTNSINPNISGPLYKTIGSHAADAFVAELNPGGSNLIYSTYLGGEAPDAAYGIAVDTSGNAYVTGFTYSTNFPTTNAIQNHLACTNSFDVNANAFVSEIASGGGAFVFSTYLGGTNFDEGKGIAVDTSGYIYVTGFTASTNFPTTNFISQVIGTNSYNGHRLNGSTNAFNPALDAFVTKLAPSGGSLVYSTYLGGTNNDMGNAIAVDNNGGAYVTGWTVSTNFPNTLGTNVIASHLTNNSFNGFIITTNVFLTKITNGISAGIAYSVVFGGNANDVGYGVAVDPTGNAFIVGATTSTNFPCLPTNNIGSLHATNFGGSDIFVTAFDPNAVPLYSVLLGGINDDFGYGIAVDSLTNAFIVGQTASTNFATAGAFQKFRNGTNDAFLAEIMFIAQPPGVTIQPTNQAVAAGSGVTFVATATGTPPFNYQWQLNGTNLVNGTNFASAGNISGVTNNILFINQAQVTNSGNYSVVVTNFGGSVTSSIAVLTVTNVATVITQQPISQTVGVGSTVTFTVGGDAQPPFFFQWLKDGTNLMDRTNISGSIISGSTTNILTIANAQTNDDGTYWLVISNAWGVLTSSNAVLTVLPSPLFASIITAGGTNFIFSGVGGTNNGIYNVLTSSNLATPFSLWIPIATNHFDSQGGFIFTNVPSTNAPQLFYLLQMP
jgi:hypothetical protein